MEMDKIELERMEHYDYSKLKRQDNFFYPHIE